MWKYAVLFAVVISLSLSQNSVRESFEYPANTAMDTLVGTATNGWGSSWDAFDLQTDVFKAGAVDMNYGDLTVTVAHTGSSVGAVNPTAWSGQRIGRYLDKQWINEAEKTYWMSFIYELSPDFTTSGWAGVSLFDSTAELYGFGHGWGNDSIGVWTDSRAPFTKDNGIQWLVGKMMMKGDSMARAFLWVSPDPAGTEPDTSNADASGDWNFHEHTGFNRIVVHCGGEGVGMSMAVDEIRLGETWGSVSSPVTNVSQQNGNHPTKFILSQNYPNPFNPSTNLSYSLPKESIVKLSVYDVMGREVAALVNNETKPAGKYVVSFNAVDLPSGVYFYKLQANNYTETKRMLLLK